MSEDLYKDGDSGAGKTGPTSAEPSKKKDEQQPDPRLKEGIEQAQAFFEAGNLTQCEAELQKVLELDPESFGAKFGLALLYRDQERLQESETQLRELDGKQPLRQAGVDVNLGVLADRNGRREDAISHYRKAIDREFQHAQAHLNLAFSLLRMGHFEEGWKEHEWRWQTEQFHPVKCLQPRWNGQQLDGTILVHTEQGAGDTFQFMRFMPMIRERCKHVLMLVPDHLRTMFSGPQWADEFLPTGSVPLDRFQAILPLMSAPHALGIGDKGYGEMVPYLAPEPRTIELGEPHVADAKLKVGIAWGGSVTHNNDAFRSCSLKQMSSLFNVPEVAFYSIQKGPQVDEIAQLQDSRLRDTDPLQNDFADAAAIMKQMDLIISVDTSVLHLAGGLGLPVWGLMGLRADWRWGIERTDSDWYPTLKMYRQENLEPDRQNWDELMSCVAADLCKVVAGDVSLG